MTTHSSLKPDLEAVGHVLGLDPTTPFDWQVAIKEESGIQVGDVLGVGVHVPGRIGDVELFGVVSNVMGLEEGAKFTSDAFLSAKGVFPTKLVRMAQVKTSRALPEAWVPPMPGATVYRASGEARLKALSFDTMKRRLPAGRTADGEAFYLDYDFLCGEKGGHVNISGISGVATKTSYASFLLYSMFESGVLGKDASNTRGVIFNVKGEDLLFLDKENSKLDDAGREAYRSLGLSSGAFRSVALRVPPKKGAGGLKPDVSGRSSGVHVYGWSVWDIIKEKLLHFMFSDVSEGHQWADVIARIEARLFENFKEDASSVGGAQSKKPDNGSTVCLGTLPELVKYIVKKLEDGDTSWTGGALQQTVGAVVRRLYSAEQHLGHLVVPSGHAKPGYHLRDSQASLTVVDIHRLHERAQRFVVGVTLAEIFRQHEEDGAARRVFIVLDELNKYAPRDGEGPIKEILLDIAERGRSLGVILIGAQQTASEVERRVASNAAIRVVGRLDMAEVQRPEYGFLDSMERRRSGLLKPGTMLVSQPMVPVPIEVTFPFPSWATRRDEVAEERDDDPFAGTVVGGR